MNCSRIYLVGLSFCLAVFLTVPAFADRDVVGPDDFLAALDGVRADLQEGKPRELSRKEWREFDKIHDRMRDLLSGVESIDALSSRQQTRVFNLQEELDTLLIGRRFEQVVCHERETVGSRIPRRICTTVRQQHYDRDQALQAISMPSLMQAPAGPGG